MRSPAQITWPGTVRLIVGRPRRRIGNVPAEATSFVGRRRELAETRKALAGARLVSLVGPGGVGKTRLAVRAATDLGRGFANGAWWVELAEIRDAALVTNAVVAALDLRDQAATKPLQILLSQLRDSELLLVLDNCEHVLEDSAHLVAAVMRAAPNVRVLITSREPLRVQGEHVVPVPPLGLPPAGGGEPLALLRQNEAVLLFTDRAAAASGTFELTDLQSGGRRPPVPSPRRPAAGDRARRRPDPSPHRRTDPRSAHRPIRSSDWWRARGAAASADAQNDHRLEPRPADRRRAGAPATLVRLRRSVHRGRCRGGLCVRGGHGRTGVGRDCRRWSTSRW